VNLEDYPHWRVARNGEAVSRLHRADGLIALALPTGTSSIDIHWKPDWDEVLGTALTLLTVCLWLFHRRRALARA